MRDDINWRLRLEVVLWAWLVGIQLLVAGVICLAQPGAFQ
jgi:ABC-type Fe3+-siderophore transport system permease subunit